MSSLIQWRENKSFVQSSAVEEIASAAGTPLYVYDQQILREQFRGLDKALRHSVSIYYSIKANPHPRVIKVFLEDGAGCEIASGGEYVTARAAGAAAEKIVFAGPGKGREELEYVISHGIGEIHVESFDEIAALKEITARLVKPLNVSIRLNPSSALGGGLLMGGQPTAFGFEEEILPEVVEALRTCPTLKLQGVHLYTGTQILDAELLLKHWEHAVDVAGRAAELAGVDLATIDLGGGLGIPYFSHEKVLDLELLSQGVQKLVSAVRSHPKLSSAKLMVEPGRFLAGPAGIFVARVRSVKTCRGTTFVVLDGGMNHHLAASGNLGQVVRRDYPILNLSRRPSATDNVVTVVGPLCTPIDTLGRKVKMDTPQVGDLIGILQSGAYGVTASPVNFLSHPAPAEVLVTSGSFEVITQPAARFTSKATGHASA